MKISKKKKKQKNKGKCIGIKQRPDTKQIINSIMSKRRKKEKKEKKPFNIEVKNVNIITEEKQPDFKNTTSLIWNGLNREINISDEEIAYTDGENKLQLWEKYNVKVPIQYECTMIVSILLQLNTLLLNLIMPIINILLINRKINRLNNYRNIKLHTLNFIKIIIISHIIINQVDTSRLYHLIKLQSYMKIFALINFLQMIEKLTSTIMVDITTEQKTTEYTKKKNNMILDFFIQLPILFLNSLVIIMQAITFNVIINSKGNSKLNTLLITISFNKLKSSTFKRFNGSSLFQVILQDGNDRFQLNVALFIVLIKNYFHFNKILILILVTTATDWIQQIFIVRYNNINIEVYNTYKEVMMQDYLKNGIIKRFGMPVDGHIVGCIVLLYRRNISLQSWGLFVVLFLVSKVVCLYLLERLLHVYKGTNMKGIDKDTTRFIKGLPKDTDVSVESMSKVIRYEMNGKKIF